jgi:uncharacterized lipoprotein YmbA
MDYMKKQHVFIIAFSMLVLAGCGTSPPVHYYTLDSTESGYKQDPETSSILVVGPFRMPEYLKRSQMVTRGPGAEMIVDDINRWAEPLSDAFHRVVASNLDSLMESMIVATFPTAARLETEYRLIGRISSFNANQDGLVVLELQWGVGDAKGDILVKPRRSEYESQAATPGDPGAIAQAMSNTLAQFSRDVATEFHSQERGQ